jgi:uncharacterized protein
MIDLSKIVGFDWDTGNERKNEAHGVSQYEAEQVFFMDPVITDDLPHSQKELRYRALGVTETGRQLNVIFTLRANGTLIRVISARDMSRKERKHYEES